MAKKQILRLVPSGVKFKDVAETAGMTGILLTAFLGAFLKDNPDLADAMAADIREYAKTIKPKYLPIIKRALKLIESVRQP
jgi:hypothetical protein